MAVKVFAFLFEQPLTNLCQLIKGTLRRLSKNTKITGSATYMIRRRTLIQRLKDRFPDVDTVEQVVEAVIGAAPVGLTLIRNRTIEWADTSFYRMLGYKRGFLLEKSLDMIFKDPKEYDDVCERLFSTLDAGTAHEEATWVGKDGKTIQCYLRAAPVDRLQPARGHVLAAMDITGRKQTEILLRESEKRLRLLSSRLVEAQENERKVVARELHDGIGGKLTAIKYGIEKKLRESGPSRHHTGVSMEDILSVVKDAIDETRRVSKNLRPSTLDDLGLLRTINGLCREFEDLSGISITKDTEIQENQVPEIVKITIYRILQEAVNNAVKHSNADRVSVRLAENGGSVELTVEDNGKGFLIEEAEADENGTAGIGIENMKERAEMTGGQLTLWSEPNKGTIVRVVWPHREKTATS
jgi:PAS domain S-box-containing protein